MTNLFQNGTFDLTRWRRLLETCASNLESEYGLPFETISPFGFELLPNNNFLTRNLKRFHCYVGSKLQEPEEVAAVEKRFLTLLLDKLKDTDSQFLASLAIRVIRNRATFCELAQPSPPENPKILIVEHRTLAPDDHLLTDYAKYLLATVGAIASRSMSQLQRYMLSQNPRVRILQLYLMIESMLCGRVSVSDFEKSMHTTILEDIPSTEVQSYFFAHSKSAPTCNEMYYYDYILRRVDLINQEIQQLSGHAVSLYVRDFNSDARLSFKANAALVESTIQRIVATYKAYPTLWPS